MSTRPPLALYYVICQSQVAQFQLMKVNLENSWVPHPGWTTIVALRHQQGRINPPGAPRHTMVLGLPYSWGGGREQVNVVHFEIGAAEF